MCACVWVAGCVRLAIGFCLLFYLLGISACYLEAIFPLLPFARPPLAFALLPLPLGAPFFPFFFPPGPPALPLPRDDAAADAVAPPCCRPCCCCGGRGLSFRANMFFVRLSAASHLRSSLRRRSAARPSAPPKRPSARSFACFPR